MLVSTLAVALMFMDLSSVKFKTYKDKASIIAYPIQKIVDYPQTLFSNIKLYFVIQRDLIKANSQMQVELIQKRGELQKLQALRAENKRLNLLLNSNISHTESLLIASIVKVSSDPFSHKIVLNKGEIDNVKIDQPIIDSYGVMGATISINKHSARAILITDPNYSIPVENLRNGIRAIASGTGQANELILQHVPNSTDIMEGDLLVTSGLGGKFPAGYPVAKVITVKNDISKPFASIILKPCAKLDRTREVLLVKSKMNKTEVEIATTLAEDE